ncbi:hypothetical protein AURDEDRAFT_174189 [Auricularia subglabra TFB-10046 SS5]|nr:hypothetical protein AURDEDRAFT_174189 [Auricularia subglabra TFB-10046 SS5]
MSQARLHRTKLADASKRMTQGAARSPRAPGQGAVHCARVDPQTHTVRLPKHQGSPKPTLSPAEASRLGFPASQCVYGLSKHWAFAEPL